MSRNIPAVQFRNLKVGSTLTLGGTDITSSADELNILDGVTATYSELNKVAGLAATGYLPVWVGGSLTETTGAGTYTSTVAVPAGAWIIDIKVWSTVLWTASTSATGKVGDVADDDGWFTGINMKATDLLVGEELNFIQTGGKEGAYLDLTTGKRSAAYSASARSVSLIVTTVGSTGNAGRSFFLVGYVTPTFVAATKA